MVFLIIVHELSAFLVGVVWFLAIVTSDRLELLRTRFKTFIDLHVCS